jgi:hypothetical protein
MKKTRREEVVMGIKKSDFLRKTGRTAVGLLIYALLFVPAGRLLGCTIVMTVKNGLVLAGNNEDRNNADTTISFTPATSRFYGRIVFGYRDAPIQGGMNDQGLIIDGNALAPTGWAPEEGKPTFRGNAMMVILGTCATIEDARAFFEKYNVPSLERARFPIADRTGASMVVEYGQGKVQFIKSDKWYQIATNFVMSNVTNGNYPCWRYKTADRMFKEADTLSIDLIRDVLDACKQKGRALTVYSNVYDLTNGIIYLYNMSEFDNPVVLNLAEELKKGTRTLAIPELFNE